MRTFAVDRDETGNLPPLPGIFPDQMAPIVRASDGERVLTMMRWGFPPQPKLGTQPLTNVRNVASPYWRPWLKPAHRCLVPVTSFSEYAHTKPRKNAGVVRPRREPATLRLNGDLATVDGGARTEAG